MKVFDLRCGAGHGFEGWFASEDDYGTQRERGLLDCPLCGNADVMRLPSAPRLNLSGARADMPAPANAIPERASSTTQSTGLPGAGEAAQRFIDAVSELLSGAQDVGAKFAEEARRIHYGESEAKAIRGQTTAAEREALADEGIEVFTLPAALPPKSSLQ
jgi:hypothetical protein